MRIITTPMCEDILRIANIPEYEVVKVNEIGNADLVITLSETEVDIPKISVKLNTYTQLLDSIESVSARFNTECDESEIRKIKSLMADNDKNKYKRENIKVKVYSNFLTDTIKDMGFLVTQEDYDYVVVPDYMKDQLDECDNVIVVPSHRNVSFDIINRIKQRYQLLENKLCTKQ
jgi:segregation and condensation protein B